MADQGGPPLAQEARWRGPAPGRATHPPGAHRHPWLASLLLLSLSLSPQKLMFLLWFRVLVVLEHGTSISLYIPLFELKFGTNTPWYVTPSPLQLVFWLVASLVSI